MNIALIKAPLEITYLIEDEEINALFNNSIISLNINYKN